VPNTMSTAAMIGRNVRIRRIKRGIERLLAGENGGF